MSIIVIYLNPYVRYVSLYKEVKKGNVINFIIKQNTNFLEEARL